MVAATAGHPSRNIYTLGRRLDETTKGTILTGAWIDLREPGCSSDGEQEARNTAEATYQEAQEPLEQLIDGIWGPVDQAWPCGGGGADMRLMAVMVGGGAGAQARSAVELARLLGPGDPPGHLPE